MSIPKFPYLSTTEAAALLNLTVGRVRQLLIAGSLKGHKLGEKNWAIHRRDLAAFRKRRTP